MRLCILCVPWICYKSLIFVACNCNYNLLTRYYNPIIPYAQQCFDYCCHHLPVALACLLPLVLFILFHWGNEFLVPPAWIFICDTVCHVHSRCGIATWHLWHYECTTHYDRLYYRCVHALVIFVKVNFITGFVFHFWFYFCSYAILPSESGSV